MVTVESEYQDRGESWAEIVAWLEKFPQQEVSIDEDGKVLKSAWIFRGLKDSSYSLEPSIERNFQEKSMGWAALEALALAEFKARARMHLDASQIPDQDLAWLALMQHYAIPTRLLDFTFSPYVGLYFAIRAWDKFEGGGTHVRLWAVDSSAVVTYFRDVLRRTSKKKYTAVGIGPDDLFINDRDSVIHSVLEAAGVEKLLSVVGGLGEEFNRYGCVAVASPTSFNPRLASQQGVFLINLAQSLSLEESLESMMRERGNWRRILDIPVGLVPEIEKRLFQMNIHDQSLFPDMEGMAGLIRQKLRLHWA